MDDILFKGKGIHLFHLNIRSLFSANKFDMFKEQMINSNADIICLSETWLKQGLTSNIINIPGYRITRQDRSWFENNTIKKGGGVCTYINEKIIFTDSNVCKFNLSSKNIEIQWLTLRFPKMKDIIIANIYRPPQGNVKEFCKYIRECLNDVSNISKKEIFIMGDFNIDINKKTSDDSKELINMMLSFGFKQYIKETTRFGNNNTCIDLIFTNCDHINNCGTLELNYSDHQAIFISKKKQKVKHEKTSFIGRSYKNYTAEIFQESLVKENWDKLYEIENPNLAWDIFIGKIIKCLDTICPKKKFNIKKYIEKWMNRDLMELIIDKDKALKKAKKTKLNEDFIQAKRLKNEIGKIIKNAKKSFLEDEFVRAKGDNKKFWKNIYSIIPKTKMENNKDIIYLKNERNENIEIEKSASFINDFFINIGPNLAEKHNEKWNYFDEKVIKSIENLEIDIGQVYASIANIDITKSSGIDNISSRCLKDALLILNAQLSYIMRLSIKSNIFPDKWKIATVVPLFKGGKKEDVSNYRPVSLLPVPGKILEKIVHDHMMKFFDANNILCDKQNGFRPNHSTTNSIIDLTNDLFNTINRGNVAMAIFVDLKKAFDTVNHKILLEKLNYMGIRGNILAWIENYLHNRYQKTICNSTLSELGRIKCGVPQGSILGPLFFLVYINDIKNILGDLKYQLYADDTVIYCEGDNYNNIHGKLQNGLNKFVSWCSKNALTINIKKTKVMKFGSNNKIKKGKNLNIDINGENLGNTPTYKYLGINLDQTLNFKYHTENLLSLINHKLYMFSKIRRYLNVQSALSIYKTMILPYFDYGDITYMSSKTPEVKKLDRYHIRGIRICFKIQGKIDDIELFRMGKISNLENRRTVHLRNYMFKNKSKCIKKPENENVIITRENAGPRFHVLKPNCETFKRNVLYNGAVDWNNLDAEKRNIKTYHEFKRMQKSWLLNTYME